MQKINRTYTFLVTTILAAVCGALQAQQEQDLLSLLGREETTEYAAASFKTNRVINLHSWKVQHRECWMPRSPTGLVSSAGEPMNCGDWMSP
jgi:hypothetical protein